MNIVCPTTLRVVPPGKLNSSQGAAEINAPPKVKERKLIQPLALRSKYIGIPTIAEITQLTITAQADIPPKISPIPPYSTTHISAPIGGAIKNPLIGYNDARFILPCNAVSNGRSGGVLVVLA